jgi:hypothetical protein
LNSTILLKRPRNHTPSLLTYGSIGSHCTVMFRRIAPESKRQTMEGYYHCSASGKVTGEVIGADNLRW